MGGGLSRCSRRRVRLWRTDVGVGDAALQRLADGRLELGGAVGVEQAQQGGDDGADIVAAHGGVGEQALAAGCGPDQPVLAAAGGGPDVYA